MNTYSKILGVSLLGLVFLACSNSTESKSGEVFQDNEIGLRKVDLNDEKDVKLLEFEYSKTEAGESTKIERSYENAPPMIPHNIDGLLPITQDNNQCLACHDPAIAAAVGAVPVPASHTFDLRANKQLDEVANVRFNCVLCHTPQANVPPAVVNTFSPDFRFQESKDSSNLLDVINEGVKLSD